MKKPVQIDVGVLADRQRATPLICPPPRSCWPDFAVLGGLAAVIGGLLLVAAWLAVGAADLARGFAP